MVMRILETSELPMARLAEPGTQVLATTIASSPTLNTVY